MGQTQAERNGKAKITSSTNLCDFLNKARFPDPSANSQTDQQECLIMNKLLFSRDNIGKNKN